MKIVVFPFAGGNKYSFVPLNFNKDIFEILEYPGRGTRVKEDPLIDIHNLIEDLLPQVKNIIISCDLVNSVRFVPVISEL